MPWSNVNMVMNSRDRTAGSYNDSQFNAENQNIVQGQIHSLAVSEVNFPYDIPNIQTGFNSFELKDVNEILPNVVVRIFPGFYTGTELANAITLDISGQLADPADRVVCIFEEASQRFGFYNQGNPWVLESDYTFPPGYTLTSKRGPLGKDILSIMGYAYPGSTPAIFSSNPGSANFSGIAPLSFTQYVDICSPDLCAFQEFPGGSTTNLARRANLICRLYVSNNIAIQEAEGVRPFVINRQYFNARVMKWTTGASIGQMNIQLYDDVGQALLIDEEYYPRNYQITFNVYEGGDEKEMVTDSITGQTMSLPKYPSYRPQNAAAWSNPSFPMSGR